MIVSDGTVNMEMPTVLLPFLLCLVVVASGVEQRTRTNGAVTERADAGTTTRKEVSVVDGGAVSSDALTTRSLTVERRNSRGNEAELSSRATRSSREASGGIDWEGLLLEVKNAQADNGGNPYNTPPIIAWLSMINGAKSKTKDAQHTRQRPVWASSLLDDDDRATATSDDSAIRQIFANAKKVKQHEDDLLTYDLPANRQLYGDKMLGYFATSDDAKAPSRMRNGKWLPDVQWKQRMANAHREHKEKGDRYTWSKESPKWANQKLVYDWKQEGNPTWKVDVLRYGGSEANDQKTKDRYLSSSHEYRNGHRGISTANNGGTTFENANSADEVVHEKTNRDEAQARYGPMFISDPLVLLAKLDDSSIDAIKQRILFNDPIESGVYKGWGFAHHEKVDDSPAGKWKARASSKQADEKQLTVSSKRTHGENIDGSWSTTKLRETNEQTTTGSSISDTDRRPALEHEITTSKTWTTESEADNNNSKLHGRSKVLGLGRRKGEQHTDSSRVDESTQISAVDDNREEYDKQSGAAETSFRNRGRTNERDDRAKYDAKAIVVEKIYGEKDERKKTISHDRWDDDVKVTWKHRHGDGNNGEKKTLATVSEEARGVNLQKGKSAEIEHDRVYVNGKSPRLEVAHVRLPTVDSENNEYNADSVELNKYEVQSSEADEWKYKEFEAVDRERVKVGQGNLKTEKSVTDSSRVKELERNDSESYRSDEQSSETRRLELDESERRQHGMESREKNRETLRLAGNKNASLNRWRVETEISKGKNHGAESLEKSLGKESLRLDDSRNKKSEAVELEDRNLPPKRLDEKKPHESTRPIGLHSPRENESREKGGTGIGHGISRMKNDKEYATSAIWDGQEEPSANKKIFHGKSAKIELPWMDDEIDSESNEAFDRYKFSIQPRGHETWSDLHVTRPSTTIILSSDTSKEESVSSEGHDQSSRNDDTEYKLRGHSEDEIAKSNRWTDKGERVTDNLSIISKRFRFTDETNVALPRNVKKNGSTVTHDRDIGQVESSPTTVNARTKEPASSREIDGWSDTFVGPQSKKPVDNTDRPRQSNKDEAPIDKDSNGITVADNAWTGVRNNDRLEIPPLSVHLSNLSDDDHWTTEESVANNEHSTASWRISVDEGKTTSGSSKESKVSHEGSERKTIAKNDVSVDKLSDSQVKKERGGGQTLESDSRSNQDKAPPPSGEDSEAAQTEQGTRTTEKATLEKNENYNVSEGLNGKTTTTIATNAESKTNESEELSSTKRTEETKWLINDSDQQGSSKQVKDREDKVNHAKDDRHVDVKNLKTSKVVSSTSSIRAKSEEDTSDWIVSMQSGEMANQHSGSDLSNELLSSGEKLQSSSREQASKSVTDDTSSRQLIDSTSSSYTSPAHDDDSSWKLDVSTITIGQAAEDESSTKKTTVEKVVRDGTSEDDNSKVISSASSEKDRGYESVDEKRDEKPSILTLSDVDRQHPGSPTKDSVLESPPSSEDSQAIKNDRTSETSETWETSEESKETDDRAWSADVSVSDKGESSRSSVARTSATSRQEITTDVNVAKEERKASSRDSESITRHSDSELTTLGEGSAEATRGNNVAEKSVQSSLVAKTLSSTTSAGSFQGDDKSSRNRGYAKEDRVEAKSNVDESTTINWQTDEHEAVTTERQLIEGNKQERLWIMGTPPTWSTKTALETGPSDNDQDSIGRRLTEGSAEQPTSGIHDERYTVLPGEVHRTRGLTTPESTDYSADVEQLSGEIEKPLETSDEEGSDEHREPDLITRPLNKESTIYPGHGLNNKRYKESSTGTAGSLTTTKWSNSDVLTKSVDESSAKTESELSSTDEHRLNDLHSILRRLNEGPKSHRIDVIDDERSKGQSTEGGLIRDETLGNLRESDSVVTTSKSVEGIVEESGTPLKEQDKQGSRESPISDDLHATEGTSTEGSTKTRISANKNQQHKGALVETDQSRERAMGASEKYASDVTTSKSVTELLGKIDRPLQKKDRHGSLKEQDKQGSRESLISDDLHATEGTSTERSTKTRISANKNQQHKGALIETDQSRERTMVASKKYASDATTSKSVTELLGQIDRPLQSKDKHGSSGEKPDANRGPDLFAWYSHEVDNDETRDLTLDDSKGYHFDYTTTKMASKPHGETDILKGLDKHRLDDNESDMKHDLKLNTRLLNEESTASVINERYGLLSTERDRIRNLKLTDIESHSSDVTMHGSMGGLAEKSVKSSEETGGLLSSDKMSDVNGHLNTIGSRLNKGFATHHDSRTKHGQSEELSIETEELANTEAYNAGVTLSESAKDLPGKTVNLLETTDKSDLGNKWSGTKYDLNLIMERLGKDSLKNDNAEVDTERSELWLAEIDHTQGPRLVETGKYKSGGRMSKTLEESSGKIDSLLESTNAQVSREKDIDMSHSSTSIMRPSKEKTITSYSNRLKSERNELSTKTDQTQKQTLDDNNESISGKKTFTPRGELREKMKLPYNWAEVPDSSGQRYDLDRHPYLNEGLDTPDIDGINNKPDKQWSPGIGQRGESTLPDTEEVYRWDVTTSKPVEDYSGRIESPLERKGVHGLHEQKPDVKYDLNSILRRLKEGFTASHADEASERDEDRTIENDQTHRTTSTKAYSADVPTTKPAEDLSQKGGRLLERIGEHRSSEKEYEVTRDSMSVTSRLHDKSDTRLMDKSDNKLYDWLSSENSHTRDDSLGNTEIYSWGVKTSKPVKDLSGRTETPWMRHGVYGLENKEFDLKKDSKADENDNKRYKGQSTESDQTRHDTQSQEFDLKKYSKADENDNKRYKGQSTESDQTRHAKIGIATDRYNADMTIAEHSKDLIEESAESMESTDGSRSTDEEAHVSHNLYRTESPLSEKSTTDHIKRIDNGQSKRLSIDHDHTRGLMLPDTIGHDQDERVTTAGVLSENINKPWETTDKDEESHLDHDTKSIITGYRNGLAKHELDKKRYEQSERSSIEIDQSRDKKLVSTKQYSKDMSTTKPDEVVTTKNENILDSTDKHGLNNVYDINHELSSTTQRLHGWTASDHLNGLSSKNYQTQDLNADNVEVTKSGVTVPSSMEKLDEKGARPLGSADRQQFINLQPTESPLNKVITIHGSRGIEDKQAQESSVEDEETSELTLAVTKGYSTDVPVSKSVKGWDDRKAWTDKPQFKGKEYDLSDILKPSESPENKESTVGGIKKIKNRQHKDSEIQTDQTHDLTLAVTKEYSTDVAVSKSEEGLTEGKGSPLEWTDKPRLKHKEYDLSNILKPNKIRLNEESTTRDIKNIENDQNKEQSSESDQKRSMTSAVSKEYNLDLTRSKSMDRLITQNTRLLKGIDRQRSEDKESDTSDKWSQAEKSLIERYFTRNADKSEGSTIHGVHRTEDYATHNNDRTEDSAGHNIDETEGSTTHSIDRTKGTAIHSIDRTEGSTTHSIDRTLNDRKISLETDETGDHTLTYTKGYSMGDTSESLEQTVDETETPLWRIGKYGLKGKQPSAKHDLKSITLTKAGSDNVDQSRSASTEMDRSHVTKLVNTEQYSPVKTTYKSDGRLIAENASPLQRTDKPVSTDKAPYQNGDYDTTEGDSDEWSVTHGIGRLGNERYTETFSAESDQTGDLKSSDIQEHSSDTTTTETAIESTKRTGISSEKLSPLGLNSEWPNASLRWKGLSGKDKSPLSASINRGGPEADNDEKKRDKLWPVRSKVDVTSQEVDRSARLDSESQESKDLKDKGINIPNEMHRSNEKHASMVSSDEKHVSMKSTGMSTRHQSATVTADTSTKSNILDKKENAMESSVSSEEKLDHLSKETTNLSNSDRTSEENMKSWNLGEMAETSQWNDQHWTMSQEDQITEKITGSEQKSYKTPGIEIKTQIPKPTAKHHPGTALKSKLQQYSDKNVPQKKGKIGVAKNKDLTIEDQSSRRTLDVDAEPTIENDTLKWLHEMLHKHTNDNDEWSLESKHKSAQIDQDKLSSSVESSLENGSELVDRTTPDEWTKLDVESAGTKETPVTSIENVHSDEKHSDSREHDNHRVSVIVQNKQGKEGEIHETTESSRSESENWSSILFSKQPSVDTPETDAQDNVRATYKPNNDVSKEEELKWGTPLPYLHAATASRERNEESSKNGLAEEQRSTSTTSTELSTQIVHETESPGSLGSLKSRHDEKQTTKCNLASLCRNSSKSSGGKTGNDVLCTMLRSLLAVTRSAGSHGSKMEEKWMNNAANENNESDETSVGSTSPESNAATLFLYMVERVPEGPAKVATVNNMKPSTVTKQLLSSRSYEEWFSSYQKNAIKDVRVAA